MRTFLFILALVVLVGIGLFLRSHGILIPGGEKKSEKIQAKFTPEELIALVDNYSIDRIAGECESKNFVMFRYAVKSANGQNCNQFQYYYLSKKPTDYYRSYQSECEKIMEEKLSTWDNERSIYYTIKSKQDYSQFINFLKENKEDIPTQLENLSAFTSDSFYVFRDCIFIDRGYSLDFNGFTFYIMPISELVSKITENNSQVVKAENNNNSENSTKKSDGTNKGDSQEVSSPTVGYIYVNEASAYEHPTNSYGWMCNLKKNTKLKIIKKAGDFYYCDFVNNEGEAKTGWIQEDDITFKKPKEEEIHFQGGGQDQ